MTTPTPSAAASLLRSGAYKRFQVMAWVTGVLLAFMTVVGLPWKYILGNGFLYMAYLVTVIDLAIRAKWAPGRTVLVALAGTIPFMSFVFERRTTHQLRAAARTGAPSRSRVSRESAP
jgi:integral membrane protein